MNKECLEQQIEELGPWNFLVEWSNFLQNIIVQDYLSRTLLPLLDRLNKKERSETSVIDIGCGEGWLCLLLYRSGYRRIFGIDSNERNIRKANLLKNHFGMEDVEFQCRQIQGFKTDELFDFSIMFGLINIER